MIKVKKYKDVYTVISTELIATTVKLYKNECIGGSTLLNTYIIPPLVVLNLENTQVLPITNDGDYYLEFNNNKVCINNYKTLTSKVINTISSNICKDCGCNQSVEDCLPKEAKDCLSYQTLFNNIQVLNNVTKPFKTIIINDDNNCSCGCSEDCNSVETWISSYINEFINRNKCTIIESLCKEQIDKCLGKDYSFDTQLFKSFIGYNYLALYYYELNQAIDQSEIDYIKSKYSYNKISRCLSKLEVDISVGESINNDFKNEKNTAPIVADNFVGKVTNSIYPHLEFAFTSSDFLTDYYDKEGNLPNNIKILYAPSIGDLYYNGNLINIYPFITPISNIGLVQYKLGDDITKPTVLVPIYYEISDISTNSLYSKTAIFKIVISKGTNGFGNIIGDINKTVTKGSTTILSASDFNGIFIDPENDPIYRVRFMSIPVGIEVKVGSTILVNGDAVDFIDIQNGLLSITTTLTTPIGISDIIIQIADIGSTQYVS